MTEEEYASWVEEAGPKPFREDTIMGKPKVSLEVWLPADHKQSVEMDQCFPEPANEHERVMNWCWEHCRDGWAEFSFFEKETYRYCYCFHFADPLEAARCRAEFGL